MAGVEDLVASLTLDEKAALLAGEDLWSTVAIDRVSWRYFWFHRRQADWLWATC